MGNEGREYSGAISGMESVPWCEAQASPSIAVLTLALGIGANTAIFQLLDAVRLRNLPVTNPSELTVVRLADLPGWRGNQETAYPALNNPLWEYIRDHQHVFSQVLAWSPTNLGITEGDHERLVQGLWVSGDFFNALGVRPALGRVFASSDDRPGCGAAGVVLSYAFWQGQFGGNPQAVGRTLIIGAACGSDSGSDTSRFYRTGSRSLF